MSVKRHRPPATITSVPRNTLAHAHHRAIDGVLKDLKLCSRRLKATVDAFKDELRILERLYYKCKNQHRMALFFKRIPEMRRYGRRLIELDILERVDLLRASFVGLDHISDHKASRGPWSHVPEKPYVDFLTERLSACAILVCKMRECLERAYNQFTLAMQSGAFVQFIILFVAISSRMSALSSELGEALRLGISTCNRLLTIIHPMGPHATTDQRLLLDSLTSRPLHGDHDVPLGDTGAALPHEPMDIPIIDAEDLGTNVEATMEAGVTPLGHTTNGNGPIITRISKKVATQVDKKPRVKKAKRKLDEIDEIFGF